MTTWFSVYMIVFGVAVPDTRVTRRKELSPIIDNVSFEYLNELLQK